MNEYRIAVFKVIPLIIVACAESLLFGERYPGKIMPQRLCQKRRDLFGGHGA
ncbi:hypothetical protein OB2597_08194 [Pseudooceanicola batsensis HTCC2597]|uniref:Uncharacterized protein n=1 Tax=Pseudooceanicola batsensis (strain ATCC BAA-863 / DSM 15984 / KCTC 12145 / HTCC2597) TaxID=252305 RepID=A3TUB1_PSEBH|nr:hypothetical protein OB2597_08194 [Pseudooceanicola batsensis HTCC2597]